MSAPIRLYVDTFNKVLVAGFRSKSSVQIGDLYYGNILTLRVYLLEPNPATSGSHPAPYSYMDNSDIGLTVAIVDPGTGAAPTTYASQIAWTKDADNTYFEADFALDNPAIGIALGAASFIQRTLEIAFSKGAKLTTVYQELININTRGITNATQSVPAGEIALSEAKAANTYMPYVLPKGQSATFPSPSGVYGTVCYTDDNGVFHTDPIVFNPPL